MSTTITTHTIGNAAQVMLDSIFSVMQNEHFSKDRAAKIVGGEKKLLDLIAAGEIQAEKKTNKQNGTWYCNASDVLRHCRNVRK